MWCLIGLMSIRTHCGNLFALTWGNASLRSNTSIYKSGVHLPSSLTTSKGRSHLAWQSSIEPAPCTTATSLSPNQHFNPFNHLIKVPTLDVGTATTRRRRILCARSSFGPNDGRLTCGVDRHQNKLISMIDGAFELIEKILGPRITVWLESASSK